MHLFERMKPISYFRAHAAELLQELSDRREPVAITQNGVVKAVVQDIASYEEMQERLTVLRLLALGLLDVEDGPTRLADEIFAELESHNRH
jgi:prevent-host-death family protein